MKAPVPHAIRIARLVSVAVLLLRATLLIGLGVWMGWSVTDGGVSEAGKPDDWYAYSLGAERILHGQPLYLDPGYAHDLTWRFAPWLAFLWVPLNALGALGPNLWLLLCFASAAYVIASLFRLGGSAGVMLSVMALSLVGAIPQGNVGLPMLALLVWRRADPWSIAIAASLKVYPLLLALAFVAERRWRDLALTVGLTVALWLPALAFNIGDWRAPGPAGIQAPLGVVLLAGLVPLALAVRGSRWTRLAVGAFIPVGVGHYVGSEYVWLAALSAVNRTDARVAGRLRLWVRRGSARPLQCLRAQAPESPGRSHDAGNPWNGDR
jgi:hypothetical protein